jgi:hypothetical protein
VVGSCECDNGPSGCIIGEFCDYLTSVSISRNIPLRVIRYVFTWLTLSSLCDLKDEWLMNVLQHKPV